MAVDPQTQILWLYGRTKGAPGRAFLKVTTEGEPDVLVDQAEFDVELYSITHDGSYLWGVVDDTILQIDPETFEVVNTYILPDMQLYLIALEAVNGKYYALCIDSGGNDLVTLLEVSTGQLNAPADPPGGVFNP